MDRDHLRDKDGLTLKEFLKQYDPNKYPRPSVALDLVVFTVLRQGQKNYRKLPNHELRVLMIRRGNHPCLRQWALPGGFLNVGESLEDAAARELFTETNVSGIYMEQLYTWGEVNRDPRTRVLSCSYMSLVDSTSLQLKPGDDAADAKWFKVEDKVVQEEKTEFMDGFRLKRTIKLTLNDDNHEEITAILQQVRTVQGRRTRVDLQLVESDDIAFDHGKIIYYALDTLRAKLERTDLAFCLVPELFTLTELQKVYEVILGRPLLAANFRRKTDHMIEKTDEYQTDAGHRPSRLCRFVTDWSERKSDE